MQALAPENTVAEAINASRISDMISSQDYNKRNGHCRRLRRGSSHQDTTQSNPEQLFRMPHLPKRVSPAVSGSTVFKLELCVKKDIFPLIHFFNAVWFFLVNQLPWQA